MLVLLESRSSPTRIRVPPPRLLIRLESRTRRLPLRILQPRLPNLKALLVPRPPICRRKLPITESPSTSAPPPPSSSSRTQVSDPASVPNPSASATTCDAPIELVTETEVPLKSPASPISFSSWNTSRSQWSTSQTRVALPELPSIETSPRNVTTDPREEPRRTPESVESLVTAAPACAYSADSARANSHQFDERRGRDSRGDEPVHLQG